MTTQQVFGDKLHTYTIVDAIRDKNVLPFMISYVNTVKTSTDAENSEVTGINTESALLAQERIRQVTAYILENFDRKTKRGFSYDFQQLLNISEVASSKKVVEVKKSQRHGLITGSSKTSRPTWCRINVYGWRRSSRSPRTRRWTAPPYCRMSP